MSLKDEGFRFCASHGTKVAKWIDPAYLSQGDWVDLTDVTDDELAAYFAAAPAREVEVA